MFTGIIEETGIVQQITENNIKIKCNKVLQNTKLGDSIAVDGVCLTVTEIAENDFSADISQETKKTTNLGFIKTGHTVNLERAMQLSERIGGHIVSGHIDTVGKITSINTMSEFYEIEINFDSKYNKYTVNKGSITVNGISLTIANCENSRVKIAIIPHTFKNTTLKNSYLGENVNIEFDILAKYVEKNLLSTDNNRITMNKLQENGFI